VVLGPGATVSSALAALRDGGTLISNAALRPEEQVQARARGIRTVTSRGTTAIPLETLTQLAEEGFLTASVGKTFALHEAAQSHAYAQSGQGFGRFALRVVEEDSLLS
jgi:NADPH:quinone reductase-like Zn-dependent oxidoreductase